MHYFFNAVIRGLGDDDADQFKLNQDNAINLVTVIRHPASRMRSHFDYYIKSTGKYDGPFESWLYAKKDAWFRNFQSIEMGIYGDK